MNDDLYGNSSLQAQMGPLLTHLNDNSVREILFNKPYEYWVMRDKWELIRDESYSLERLQRMATTISTFDGGKPPKSIMSRRGPRGERIQIVTSPACLDGYFGMNIRKHVEVSYSLDQLIEQGAFSRTGAIGSNNLISDVDQELLELKAKKDWKAFFSLAVRAKKNIIIVGATGSGKTTFYRAVMDEVDRSERVITIEDTHELFLEDFPNKLHLTYGASELDVSSQLLLEASMRLSPDRILLGELRGHEAWDYLQSLNTGHPGSITTVHANSAVMGFNRIAMLIKQSPVGSSMTFDAIASEVMSSIDISVYLSQRKVVEVYFDPKQSLKI